MLALVKTGVPEVIEWRWVSVVETAWSILGLQCAMQCWPWEKFNFKDRNGDDSDAEIPVLNGAGAAADQNQGNKNKCLSMVQ